MNAKAATCRHVLMLSMIPTVHMMIVELKGLADAPLEAIGATD